MMDGNALHFSFLKSPKKGEHYCHRQQKQAEFVAAVAAVHELLKFLKQQGKHFLSRVHYQYTVWRRVFSTGQSRLHDKFTIWWKEAQK